jgi:hypothetical protein
MPEVKSWNKNKVLEWSSTGDMKIWGQARKKVGRGKGKKRRFPACGLSRISEYKGGQDGDVL